MRSDEEKNRQNSFRGANKAGGRRQPDAYSARDDQSLFGDGKMSAFGRVAVAGAERGPSYALSAHRPRSSLNY